jgi:hypothetical protein
MTTQPTESPPALIERIENAWMAVQAEELPGGAAP